LIIIVYGHKMLPKWEKKVCAVFWRFRIKNDSESHQMTDICENKKKAFFVKLIIFKTVDFKLTDTRKFLLYNRERN
jgi:hypothetical protein